MKMKQMRATLRKRRTESAEPIPSWSWPIDWLYVRKETVAVFWAPAVMTKTESKTRKASRVRKRRATMIAAFMFGMITFDIRRHQEAPSTVAASSMSPGICARPESRRSEMNGVVFQISAAQMTRNADQKSPNQSNSGIESHVPTKPVPRSKAYFHEKAATTVMMP